MLMVVAKRSSTMMVLMPSCSPGSRGEGEAGGSGGDGGNPGGSGQHPQVPRQFRPITVVSSQVHRLDSCMP